jgi:hypothetical protein
MAASRLPDQLKFGHFGKKLSRLQNKYPGEWLAHVFGYLKT